MNDFQTAMVLLGLAAMTLVLWRISEKLDELWGCAERINETLRAANHRAQEILRGHKG
jgi:hypothetical protein